MTASTEKVFRYAFMVGKPFTCRKLMADVGMPHRTAARAISELLAAGEIVRLGAKKDGIYRVATPRQKAAFEDNKRRMALEDMRLNGAEYERILKEAI